MWLLFQCSIIFAVISSNIYWKWTPNGFVASLFGVGAAYGLTIALTYCIQRVRQRRISRDQSRQSTR
jgi:hypothetical protein